MIRPVLEGLKVLVCRPEPAASQMLGVLTSVGARAKTLPCIEISELPPDAAARQLIFDLDKFEHVIVTSQHAASIAMSRIDEVWPQLPVGQTWHAIGRQTARSLPAEILNMDIPTSDLSSEELLKTNAFAAIKNKRVLILKGTKGRSTIHRQLRGLGAQVSELELYERIKPKYTHAELSEAILNFDPDFFIALSGETLTNLNAYFKQINFDASNKSFILSSNRVANIAIEQGFNLTYVPKNLMPIDIIQCLARVNRT